MPLPAHIYGATMNRKLMVISGALLSGALISTSVILPAVAQNSTVQEILNAHNRYRAEVGVPPLTWSTTLADHAQQWANHLAPMGGTLVHATEQERAGEGENLFSGWSSGTLKEFTLNKMIGDWGNEKQYYNGGVSPNFSSTGNFVDVGHYTQMVWGKTTEVGCGSADVGQTRVFVCRYYPTGNTWGEAPYSRARVASAPGSTDNLAILHPGQRLRPGQYMQSNNKLHTLIMQKDGNVVLYDHNSHALWSTNTGGLITPREFVMQTDGNLVLYSTDGRARWASNTWNNPGAFFDVQDDGDLVVYKARSTVETAKFALWASASNDSWR